MLVVEKLIKIATAEIGTKESNAGDDKYIKWYGGFALNVAWCAIFVSWCANQAGIGTGVIPKYASCDAGMNWFKKKGTFEKAKYFGGGYTPQAGDVIFFSDNGNQNDSTHTGIVTSCNGSKVYTIEGNTSDMVHDRSYAIGDDYILGYGVPSYNKVIATPVVVVVTPSTATGVKVGDTVTFTGSLHYTSSYDTAVAKACRGGLATITAVASGRPHPYHLKAVSGKGSTVNGWVNASDIGGATSSTAKYHTVVSGDTLSKIASKYGTTVDKLVALNGIKNKNLIKL